MSESNVAASAANGRAALYAALARAQKECRTAELDGRFEGGKVRYPFTSAQERMAVARDSLGKHGLALVRRGLPKLEQLSMSRELVDTTTGNLTTETYAQRMLEQDFLLVHEGGEALEVGFRWPVMEGPGRPLDKAWAAADTSGLSYLIRDVLLIPSEESEDLREREGSGGKIVQMPSRPPAPVPALAKPAGVVSSMPQAPAVAPAAATSPRTAPGEAPQPAPAPVPTPASPVAADAGAAGPSSAPAAPASAPVTGLQLVDSGPDVFDEAARNGPVAEHFAAGERAKVKLAAAPLAATKLYALQPDAQDKPLWLEVFAVAEKRFGSRERTIAAVKELGVPQGTVPSIAQLRKFVEVMP